MGRTALNPELIDGEPYTIYTKKPPQRIKDKFKIFPSIKKIKPRIIFYKGIECQCVDIADLKGVKNIQIKDADGDIVAQYTFNNGVIGTGMIVFELGATLKASFWVPNGGIP